MWDDQEFSELVLFRASEFDEKAANSQVHNKNGSEAEKERERVPCPLDPNHTVWAESIKKAFEKMQQDQTKPFKR